MNGAEIDINRVHDGQMPGNVDPVHEANDNRRLMTSFRA